ncbi:hypothetical protein NDA03_06350 [Trichocoleus sp. Lan]|uniref:hypothetical protein n=1 Tax=Trichocoleus sp. Lan TaxID=2933927 RepID=UPI00329751D1
MFGFIKKLLGGITAFIGGIFGSKKSEGNEAAALPRKKSGGYYMELEESKDAKPAAQESQKKPEPVKARTSESKKPEPAKASASASKSASNGQKDSSKPQATPELVGAASKNSSNSKEVSEPKEIAQRPPVELIQTAEGVEAVVAEKPAAPINGKGQSQSDTTFAPKYLNPISSSNTRRRPGPSMSNFMDMARQVKK